MQLMSHVGNNERAVRELHRFLTRRFFLSGLNESFCSTSSFHIFDSRTVLTLFNISVVFIPVDDEFTM